MTTNLTELRRQRDAILQQIHSIDRLRRGTLSEQFFTRKQAGKAIRQGPYYVLQCSLKGTKCSERIPADQADQAQSDVANYRKFQTLADQFVHLTDQMTRWESGQADAKKNSRWRKSPRSSSPNHGPS